jgi:putative transposase
VLQDVLTRLDRAFQRIYARVKVGEKAGYPRIRGAARYHSFTYKQVGEHGGAHLYNSFLVISKIGRVTVSREADGWYVRFSCADVPT